MNPHQNRKRPNASFILDAKRLRDFRQRAGLSLNQVAEMTGVGKSTLCAYEHAQVIPQLHQLKKLIEIYELDLLEVCDLLRINLIERRLIRDFRAACKKEGTTPAQALRDFLLVYAYQ